MGRVLCEANAAELPVVAARSGGIPSVIGEETSIDVTRPEARAPKALANGQLFEPDNARDLIAAICRMRERSELAGRLTEAGLRLARERFDWSVVLGTHERAIHRLIEERHLHERSATNTLVAERVAGSGGSGYTENRHKPGK